MRDDPSNPNQLRGRPSLVGLEPHEEQRTAEEFFAMLPWEPLRLDPRAMTAAQFLDAL